MPTMIEQRGRNSSSVPNQGRTEHRGNQKRNRRFLKALALATAVSGGTGLLLFLPPFAIWPLYSFTLGVHTWLGMAVTVFFVPAFFIHGIKAWRRRGFHRLTQSGLALGVFFLAAAGSGIAALFWPEVPSWLFVLHMLCGGVSIILALLHGLRTKGQKL